MKTSLKGKTVVVTGAARGIGEQVARLAATRAPGVGLIGLEPDTAARTCPGARPDCGVARGDVRDIGRP